MGKIGKYLVGGGLALESAVAYLNKDWGQYNQWMVKIRELASRSLLMRRKPHLILMSHLQYT